MEWCSFVGATHVIPTEDEHALQKTAQAQTPDKTRELPQAIPYEDRDFEPIKQQPANVQFQDEHYGSKLEDEDPTIIMMKRKQARLATIHEKLGHPSFPRLKLLARSGIIPKELAHVDPP